MWRRGRRALNCRFVERVPRSGEKKCHFCLRAPLEKGSIWRPGPCCGQHCGLGNGAIACLQPPPIQSDLLEKIARAASKMSAQQNYRARTHTAGQCTCVGRSYHHMEAMDTCMALRERPPRPVPVADAKRARPGNGGARAECSKNNRCDRKMVRAHTPPPVLHARLHMVAGRVPPPCMPRTRVRYAMDTCMALHGRAPRRRRMQPCVRARAPCACACVATHGRVTVAAHDRVWLQVAVCDCVCV